ncbi:MAG: UDP-N-acetylmuramoyl-tripeptide--D-alanyl-D-alanine ligase [Actinomycetota bacterium]|nr:UDP-N-acetylmuramoyl-tripeptide--D-alanyl-D-alanine ligase [Actinomycetota bacterium]
MRFRASEIAEAVGGSLVGPDVEVDGVTIDSRGVTGGELFVPVVAGRDGHDFVGDAMAAGASAYLTARRRLGPGATAIEVADTSAALLALGRHARLHLPDRAIGITGSVGKTSVKDLTAAALGSRYRVAASERSFNNELGVPLTLANAPADTECVVVEMGARGRGHITVLCEVARPTIGVVTVVAAAHTELFGSVANVASAKAELVEALPLQGTAVLNADDERVVAMRRATEAAVLTFSASGDARADVVADHVRLDDQLRPAFVIRSPWGRVEVALAVHGGHNVTNALAATAAAVAAGATLEEAAAGLAHARLAPHRMELTRTSSGLLVLDDSYNANPTSTEAALRSLAQLPARRRVAVLGLMAELGPEGPQEHRRIGRLARSLGIEVVAVDVGHYGPEAVSGVEGAFSALEALGPLGGGDAVLVKASRVAGLDRLSSMLLSAGAGDPPGQRSGALSGEGPAAMPR